MSLLRRPAVAGLFYPDDPTELARSVRGYLDAGAPSRHDHPTDHPSPQSALQAARQQPPPPKALIAPHAGYVYSGPVAGHAYACIAAHARHITRVILLGPAHRLAFRGLAFSRAERFATPLGEVRVDRAAIQTIAQLGQVQALDAAFDGEHCIEVQLPFLQTLLTDFRIVPLLVGAAGDADVAEVLERLWGGKETLIVVSSDLSHYLDYGSAQRVDRQTSAAICSLKPQEIASHQACGHEPIAGLLLEARRHGLHAELLDLRNSGDTAGPRDRVVGYGAYAFA